MYILKDEYYFVLFQLLDVAATDLLNKSSGSPATTPLHLVVSFLCHSFIFEILCNDPYIQACGLGDERTNGFEPDVFLM